MNSIRRQLMLLLLLGFGLLLAAGCTTLYLATRGMLLSEFDATLATKARALASLTERQGSTVELHFEDAMMPEFGKKHRDAYFQLWIGEEHVLERSTSLGSGNLPRRAAHSPGMPLFWNLILPSGKSGRAVGYSFLPPEDDERTSTGQIEPATVVVAMDRTPLDSNLRAIALGATIASALMIAGAVIVTTFSVRRSLAPLDKLGLQVAKIDASSLSARLACDHLPSELAPICDRLNHLLARLDAAFTREKRFSDDVAHELRTPVAELRALAEFSLQSVSADAPVRACFRDTLAVAEQMEEIVNGLLTIARCESGNQGICLESLPLFPLLENIWQSHAVRAAERLVTRTFDVPPDLCVSGDRALLRTILGNLLANAAAYSPSGSEIRVSVHVEKKRVRLMVSNPAGELTDADLPHLFERFWRKDPSRTSSTHAGLGLSIASAAANLLGATLTAEITVEGNFITSLALLVAARGPCSPALQHEP